MIPTICTKPFYAFGTAILFFVLQLSGSRAWQPVSMARWAWKISRQQTQLAFKAWWQAMAGGSEA